MQGVVVFYRAGRYLPFFIGPDAGKDIILFLFWGVGKTERVGKGNEMNPGLWSSCSFLGLNDFYEFFLL